MHWRSALRTMLYGAAALALAHSAQAQEGLRARLVTPPEPQNLQDSFPVVALVRGISGRVVLTCQVTADGESECAATDENPSGMGFAAAAEQLARDWRFAPQQQDGVAMESDVRIPVVFSNPNAQPLPIEVALSVRATRAVESSHSAAASDPESHDVIACRWATGGHCWNQNPNTSEGDVNARYYPQSALDAAVNGRALVTCLVQTQRRSTCQIEQEAPTGQGFGDRALDLVSDIIAQRIDRFEAGRAFRVPVDFKVRGRGAPADQSIWQWRPTAEDFVRFYPGEALDHGISGAVLLVCGIRVDRRLNCDVAEEVPSGHQFGPAGQRISTAFLLRESELGRPGLAAGDRIKIPIRFGLR